MLKEFESLFLGEDTGELNGVADCAAVEYEFEFDIVILTNLPAFFLSSAALTRKNEGLLNIHPPSR